MIVRAFLVLVASTTALWSCSGTPVRDPVDSPAADTSVAYRLRLVGTTGALALAAEVTVRDADGLPEPLEWVVPESWAGFDGLGEVMVDMVAVDEDGSALRLHREPGLARVAHEGAEVIRVRYLIEPVARELMASTRFQALERPTFIFGYGRNLFIWPRHLPPEADSASLSLESGPTGTRWATTLGAIAESWEIDGLSYFAIAEEAYLAGAVNGGGAPDGEVGAPFFGAVTDPELALDFDGSGVPLVPGATPADALTSLLVANAETIEGGLLGDSSRGAVGIVLRRADDDEAATGTGRPGGIVLELGDDVDWRAYALTHLVQHEFLHRSIGFGVRFATGHELATLWFKEGAVEYLATLASAQPWVRDPADGIRERMGAIITGYLQAESRGDAGFEQLWESAGARRAHYDRGALVTFGLVSLLEARGVAPEDFFSTFVRAHIGGEPLTEQGLVDALVASAPDEARADVAEFLDSYVTSALPLPVERWLERAGWRLETVEETAPYFGVRVTRGRDGSWRVASVDPRGPAGLSGLREGERLLEPPVLPTGGGDARFVVIRGSSRRVLVVESSRGTRTRWVVRALAGAQEAER